MIFRLPDAFSARRVASNRFTRKPNKPSATQTEGNPIIAKNFHLRSLKRAWRPFAERSLAHWTTTSIIAITLAIYGAFSLLLVNSNKILNTWDDDNLMTVFMQRSAERNHLILVGKTIKSSAGTSQLTVVSPADALKRLKTMMGNDAGLLAELDENPLPYSIEFKLSGEDPTQAATMAREIGALPGVETVTYDRQWADRLASVISAIRYTGNILSFLLLGAVTLVVSNTIKLTIIARRDEMEIMRFMGADDVFIKTPFIYEGVLQGVIGATGALILTGLLYLSAKEPILNLLHPFGTLFQLEFLPITQLGLLLVIGASLGLSGAFISVSRFLDA